MIYPEDRPSPPTAPQLQALQENDRARLRLSAQATIKRLCPKYTTQEKLERVLGLSAAYISHVRRGARTPSPSLVVLLELIAIHPKVRLKELESLNQKRGTSPQLHILSDEQTDDAT